MSDAKQKKTQPAKKPTKVRAKPKSKQNSVKSTAIVDSHETIVGRIARYTFYVLLAYMPVHIFLSTWIGASLDILAPAKVAKEFVLIIGFVLALSASVKKPWFKYLLSDKLMWAIGGFVLLHIFVMAMRPTDAQVEILALAYNTRYLVFFVYAVLLAHLYNRAHLVKRSVQVVLAVASLVLVFGALQHSILPDNTLERLGYSEQAGVLPVVLVDNNPDFPRVFSTQRNPNSYGSYLLIIITIAMVYLRFAKRYASRYVLVGLLGLGMINLLYTYSRSAWLGFVFTIIALVALLIKQGMHRKLKREVRLVLYTVTAGLLLIGGAMAFSIRDSYTFQNLVFHSTNQSTADSSNIVRLSYWQTSLQEVADNPFGSGPGTAGPVSIHSENININENYYLQIALELGVAGLLLFLAILSIVFTRLWRWSSRSPIAVALMASFVGLAITNMFSHIWMYEAVAYTWWGIAGLFIVLETSKKKVKSS